MLIDTDTIRRSLGDHLPPRLAEQYASVCADKEEAYLLGRAHFQAKVLEWLREQEGR